MELQERLKSVPNPEVPDTTLFVTVFLHYQIFGHYRNKSKHLQAGISGLQVFVNEEQAGFQALWGQRVKHIHANTDLHCVSKKFPPSNFL